MTKAALLFFGLAALVALPVAAPAQDDPTAIAVNEAVLRQANTIVLRQKLVEARRVAQLGETAAAAKLYQESCELAQQIGSGIDAESAQAVNGLATARLTLARDAQAHGDLRDANTQVQQVLKVDPKNPAVWNNLANYYGEFGSPTKAFEYYAQAIKLKPDEPVYYQNFATTVYLFRKDAEEFYHIDEQQVFDKALGLYKQAMQLAPDNFTLATDYAESYYGIKPLRTNDALASWTNAMQVAHTDAERQGVELHLARVKTYAGMFAEAQAHLDTVTNEAFLGLKKQLIRSLANHEHPDTNSEAVTQTNLLQMIPQLEATQVSTATNAADLSSNLLTIPMPTPKPLPLEIAPPDLTNHVPPPPKPQ